MTIEVLARALLINNRIEALKNVINGIVSDDGQIDRRKRMEVRVKGYESSVVLDECGSDKVLSILSKEMDRLKEEFENIKA